MTEETAEKSPVTFIKVDGTIEELPDKQPTLDFMQDKVGGLIQAVRAKDGRVLVLDEEGKLKKKPVNKVATKLYRFGEHDVLVGDVIAMPPDYFM